MNNSNPTTVHLTDFAKSIKETLAPIFGLKNILSAGLLLLSELSDTEQKKAIAKANKIQEVVPMGEMSRAWSPEILLKMKEIQLQDLQLLIDETKEQEKLFANKSKNPSLSTAERQRAKRELTNIKGTLFQLNARQEAIAPIFAKLLDETYLKSIAETHAPQEPLKAVKPILQKKSAKAE